MTSDRSGLAGSITAMVDEVFLLACVFRIVGGMARHSGCAILGDLIEKQRGLSVNSGLHSGRGGLQAFLLGSYHGAVVELGAAFSKSEKSIALFS